MPPSHTPPSSKGRPSGSGGFGWRAFFQHSTTPVFVLGKGKRLRYANPAWEKLTGVKLADVLGTVFSARRSSTPLQLALAPTPEALAGRADRARRPAPPNRTGPPWWDVVFAPLAGDAPPGSRETPPTGAGRKEEPFGIVGFIAVVGEPVPAAARKIPAGVAALRNEHAKHFGPELLAGEALASARLVAQARLAAEMAAPVWIVGEPGTGKETVARVIHALSALRDRAFVAIDCAGLQPYLIESLLFGHGGLSESDRVGTVYLKDPAALPRDLQQRLADHFNERTGMRLICGSISPAQGAVAAGLLVPAYQTSLSAFEVRVPPLRERLDDLARLAARIVPERPVDAAVLPALRAHAWPGNLRELVSVLTSAAAVTPHGPVLREHLPLELRVRSEAPRAQPAKALSMDAILEAVEKRLIQLALRKSNNHQSEAADALGIYRDRLWRRLEALGIPAPPQPPKPRRKEGE
jgi:transcriptional regulator with AAA-type ATPase domain